MPPTLFLVVLAAFGVSLVLAQTCTDRDDLCKFWASRGECQKNSQWMKPNCGVSCGVCSPVAAPQQLAPEVANAINRPMGTVFTYFIVFFIEFHVTSTFKLLSQMFLNSRVFCHIFGCPFSMSSKLKKSLRFFSLFCT